MINPLVIAPLFELGKSLIDRLFPDKEKQAQERAQAELALAALAQEGRLKELATQMSAIIAEAQSPDPWTSRARPSFLYVVYVLILFSLPMGILAAFSPEMATQIAKGMKAWLAAIPSEIIELFKWVMLGYIGGRSFEKIKGAAK